MVMKQTRAAWTEWAEGHVDKPVVQGHDDTSWRQNRRGEFVQLTPPH